MYVCRGYYSTHLHSISINGKKLSIDPSVFAISNDKAGTIIDSGTTLAYLTEEAYIPFVDAVSTIKNFYQQNFIKLIFFFRNVSLLRVFSMVDYCFGNLNVGFTSIGADHKFGFIVCTTTYIKWKSLLFYYFQVYKLKSFSIIIKSALTFLPFLLVLVKCPSIHI